MDKIPEEAVKAADRAIADIIGKHSNVSTEALARAAINAGAPFLAPHKMNCADLEEAIRLAEIGEYLYNRSYSYGDGYSEPREYGIEWQWQQTKPNEFGQGALLGEAVSWHKEQADDGVITEASKLRRALSILSALEPCAARELALEEALRNLIHAVCGETGFANAVRQESGHAYPWPALDIAEAEAHRSLSSPDHADAGKVEGDGWLPIESAPKDGTAVLVHFIPNEVPSLKPLICAAYWQKSDGLMKPGFWRVIHSVGPSFTATHWRHLPSAPSEGEE